MYLHNRFAFSSNREPTIVPIPDNNVAIGRATQMSPNDILRVNRLYRCSMTFLLVHVKLTLISHLSSYSPPGYPLAYPPTNITLSCYRPTVKMDRLVNTQRPVYVHVYCISTNKNSSSFYRLCFFFFSDSTAIRPDLKPVQRNNFF